MSSRRILAVVTIIAYTVVPLVGTLVFGWDWREIMIFYWLGNISVGLSVIIDMIKSPRAAWEKMVAPTQSVGSSPPLTEAQANTLIKVYRMLSIPFFCFHYGLFTAAHGVFVFAIVNGAFGGDMSHMPSLDLRAIFLVWLVGALISLATEIMSPTNRVPSIGRAWGGAYGRIIVLHFSIIIGAFLIQALHLPAIAAVLLIVINFAIQLAQIKFTSSSVSGESSSS